MSQNESYHVNESLRNDLRLRKILEELPEFASRYFYANEFSLSARTRVAYAYDLRTFFRYIITKNPSLQYMQVRDITIAHLEQLSVHDIESYLSYLKCYHPDEQEHRMIHNTPTGIARKLSCLRSFFDYYTGIGEMKRNPAARVSTPKIHTKEIIQLDPDEVEILLSGIENGSDKISKHQKKYLDKTRLRDLAITTLLLGTGIRISECVGLDIQDVNFKDNSIKITRKGGNEQIVFFNNEVQYVLEDYLHEQRLNLIPEKGSEDALFLSLKNNRISVDAIEKMIVKYARMYVPHKRITPHKLRSTFGTQLYQETGDLYLVAETLGHSSVDTSKKYASTGVNTRRSGEYTIKVINRITGDVLKVPLSIVDTKDPQVEWNDYIPQILVGCSITADIFVKNAVDDAGIGKIYFYSEEGGRQSSFTPQSEGTYSVSVVVQDINNRKVSKEVSICAIQ